jgi:hypothetical protein
MQNISAIPATTLPSVSIVHQAKKGLAISTIAC